MNLPADPVDLLETLVAIDSTNPSIDPTGAGEAAMAGVLAEILGGLGFTVTTTEVSPDRPNVLGVRTGPAGAATILLEAHLDTVPTPPGGIEPRRTARRLWGRGACDCKASLAAMLTAVGQLLDEGEPPVTIVVAGTVDEEAAMTGAAALGHDLASGLVRVDAAIVGEPTSLVPVRAHPGVVRLRCTVGGQAAHASVPGLGRNAIIATSDLIDALAGLGHRLQYRRHPLTGPAVLTPTMITGGRSPNMVPDRCDVVVDRRVAPFETSSTALAELDRLVAGLVGAGLDVRREPPFVNLPPVELARDHPWVTLTESATGRAAGGVPFATDACHLAPAGVPCIVLGPGSIDQAHTNDEWVDLGEVRAAVAVYRSILIRAAALPRLSALTTTT